MATKIGDLFFTISGDASDVDKAVIGLASSLDKRLAYAGRVAGQAIETMLRRTLQGTVALTAEVLDLGAAYNIAGQRATGMFTALTGSLDEAQGILRNVAELSLESPIFDPAQLQQSTRLLSAYGVAADDALELAKNVNLVATAVDGGHQRAINLARALGQISAAGILQGDEARQLSEFVDVYGVIAEATGKTRVEVRKLGEEHKLLAEDVLPILNEHFDKTFGPVGQSLLNTYGVQLQGIKTIATGLGSALVEPFIGFGGGGVLTDLLAGARAEMLQFVEVTEDGGFRLIGALAPLENLVEFIAAGVENLGTRATGMLGDLDAVDTARVVNGIISTLERGLPILGSIASGTSDLLGDVVDSAKGIMPEVEELLRTAYDLGEDALPLVAEILADIAKFQFEKLGVLIAIGEDFLDIFGPTLIAGLEAFAAGMDMASTALELVGPYLDEAALGLVALTAALYAWDVAQAARVAGWAVAMNAGFGALIPTLALAGGALLSVSGAVKALQGDMSILEKDFSWLDPRKYLQELPADFGAQISDWLGGSSKQEMIEAEQAARSYADTIQLVRDAAAEWAADASLTDILTMEKNIAGFKTETKTIYEEAAQARREELAAEIELNQYQIADAREAANRWNGSLNAVTALEDGVESLNQELLDELDILKELEAAADAAWRRVDVLMQADAGSTVDEFLASLPDLARDLTDALAGDPGILRDLDVAGSLQDARAAAADVVRALAEDLGMSMDEIEALFDERGLAAVIEALGGVTEETIRTVDPLIAKYGEVSDSVELISEAIRRLEDQRTTRIRAEIDQVEAALRDAKIAAEEAKAALDAYFQGDTGGLQGVIDEIVLSIPNVGDAIEEGLLTGGPQGEAMVRQALGGLGENLAQAFSAGLEQGLSADEIIALLGPVFGSIDQELSGAANRISSLDWTEGFTPKTAQDIQEWLGGILDPALIDDLFANINATEGAIPGLEKTLEGLQAELQVEVEFSPEQVAAAIGEIETVVETTAVITPEAAEAVWKEIQAVFDDDELRAAIDEALMIQQIMDSAQQAEDQISLNLRTLLDFDPVDLINKANGVSEIFGSAFSAFLRERLRQDWNVSETPLQTEQPTVEDFMARAAELGITPGSSGGVTINNDISITESGSPIATATEVVAASSAAAGSGGRYDPSRWYGGGMRPV